MTTLLSEDCWILCVIISKTIFQKIILKFLNVRPVREMDSNQNKGIVFAKSINRMDFTLLCAIGYFAWRLGSLGLGLH